MVIDNMSLRIKQVASHILPLTILSFCLLTLKVTFDCFDGPDEVRFGFPLGWITPSLVSSLEYIVDVRALAIDFGVYLIVWCCLSQTSLLQKILSWRTRLLSVCLWAFAGLITAFYLIMLFQTGHPGGVTFNARDDCSRITSRRLHLGPF